MKYIVTILIILSFAYCKTAPIQQNIEGIYSKSGKGYNYTLKLNNDCTFFFSQIYYEINSVCQGRWQLSADTILLLCEDEDLTAKLQSGYMRQRESTAIVLGKKKLKLGGIIMRRQ